MDRRCQTMSDERTLRTGTEHRKAKDAMASWNRKKRKNRIPKLLCRNKPSWKMAPKAMMSNDMSMPMTICIHTLTEVGPAPSACWGARCHLRFSLGVGWLLVCQRASEQC